MFNSVFPKIVPFMRYVVRYGTAVQATDNNIIRSMRTACWITKATDTHSKYVILIAFPWSTVVRRMSHNITLPILLGLITRLCLLLRYTVYIYYSYSLWAPSLTSHDISVSVMPIRVLTVILMYIFTVQSYLG